MVFAALKRHSQAAREHKVRSDPGGLSTRVSHDPMANKTVALADCALCGSRMSRRNPTIATV